MPRELRIEVRDDPAVEHDVDIDAEFSVWELRYEVKRLEAFQRPEGGAITSESLRRLPVQRLLQLGIDLAVSLDAGGVLNTSDQELADIARHGPTDYTLLWVARLYTIAHVRFDPPTKTVAERLGITHRTATYWVKLARDRGVLWPLSTEEGSDG
ncbi:hypothetical protein [Agromyces indicus]|uniref:Uncharacterized protein n=1 Tax=Agromyces indicus TaxID=758919 RepID=A0ABU1FKH4_9MICO|nr:hypothetical protein [Agromyces indicus]MDR5691901.1 hypothetical protein [Agromyces indicus]